MRDLITADFRYAIRLFVRQPLISTMIVVTIALGIGTNVAVFSAAETVLFRPLPYPSSEQLVQIAGDDTHYGRTPFSYPDYLDWCSSQHTFTAIAAYAVDNFNFKLATQIPQRVAGAVVTANLFSLLGLPLEKGRPFAQVEDGELTSPLPVILSYEFWQKQFAANPNILGQTFILNDHLCEVAGVASRKMEHPGGVDFYLPMGLLSREPDFRNREIRRFYGIGRLRPQSTSSEAEADFKKVAAGLSAAYPETNSHTSVIVSSELDEPRQKYQCTFHLLLGTALAVFLIVAINVINLRLNQVRARSKEWAVRAALGANLSQVARLIALEGAVLVITGGCLGIVAAIWARETMSSLAPADLPRLGQFRLDDSLLVFSLLLIAILGIVTGLIPALRLDFGKLAGVLRGDDRVSSLGTARTWQSVLAILQVTFSFTLYMAAALLLRTLWQLQAIPLGFDPGNLLTAQIELPSNRYTDDHQVIRFFERVIGEAERTPGVECAAFSAAPPFGPVHLHSSLVGLQHAQSTLTQQPVAATLAEFISDSYFRALKIPFLRGRQFGPQDTTDSPPVSIVDERYARRFFQGQNAIGAQLAASGAAAKKRVSVIGIVSPVLHDTLTGDKSGSCIYFPLRQRAAPYGTLLIRTKEGYDPMALVSALTKIVEGVDPDQPIYNVRSMTSAVSASLNTNRIAAYLVVSFSSLALVLMAVGLYGVIGHSVIRRTREIGIRLALGAERRTILGSTLAGALKLTAIGLALGVGCTLAGSRLLSSLVPDLSVLNISTFVLGIVVLGAVTFVASLLPAWRASRVDPVAALRSDG